MDETGKQPESEMTMEEIKESIQKRKDVITLALSVREGGQAINVRPLSNGFMVELTSVAFPESSPQTFVFKKVNEVGTLMHRLMNGNLDNPEVIKSIRRLLGYM